MGGSFGNVCKSRIGVAGDYVVSISIDGDIDVGIILDDDVSVIEIDVGGDVSIVWAVVMAVK